MRNFIPINFDNLCNKQIIWELKLPKLTQGETENLNRPIFTS